MGLKVSEKASVCPSAALPEQWTSQSISNWIGRRIKLRQLFLLWIFEKWTVGEKKKRMFMASKETFGSQRSLRGVPPSEKLHSLPKYTQKSRHKYSGGDAARLPELTQALHHNFINCSEVYDTESDCEASKHISLAKCAEKNHFIENISVHSVYSNLFC